MRRVNVAGQTDSQFEKRRHAPRRGRGQIVAQSEIAGETIQFLTESGAAVSIVPP